MFSVDKTAPGPVGPNGEGQAADVHTCGVKGELESIGVYGILMT